MPKSQFLFNGFDEWKGQGNLQGHEPVGRIWSHSPVPHRGTTAGSGSRNRISAAPCGGWYTMTLPKATSVPAETCISLNIHPPGP